MKYLILIIFCSTALLQSCAHKNTDQRSNNVIKQSKIFNERVKVDSVRLEAESLIGNQYYDYIFRVSKEGFVIANVRKRTISLFDLGGNFLKNIGNIGRGPGEFQAIQGLDIAPSGDIYISDNSLKRVTKYNSNGDYLDTYSIKPSMVGLTTSGEKVFGLNGVGDGPYYVSALDVNSKKIADQFYDISEYFEKYRFPIISLANNISYGGGKLYTAHHFDYKIKEFTSSGVEQNEFIGESKFFEPPNDGYFRAIRDELSEAVSSMLIGLFYADGHIYTLMYELRDMNGDGYLQVNLEVFNDTGYHVYTEEIDLGDNQPPFYVDKDGILYDFYENEDGSIKLIKSKLI